MKIKSAEQVIGEGHEAFFNFKAIEDKDSVVIEGFANKAIVDRGGDLIPPEAWDLKDYANNPIIFFNHDRNIPIGKAIGVKVTEDGLKIKVQISKSNEAPIPFIRDMIKEGILKTFSVGFDPQDSGVKQKDGSNKFEIAKLLETSVVTLPMNEESTFDVSKAGDLAKIIDISSWKTKSYDICRKEVLKVKNTKGAIIASQILSTLARAQLSVANFDKAEKLAEIASKGGVSSEELTEILAGNVTPVPEAVIEAFSNVLMLNSDWLKEDASWEESKFGVEGAQSKEDDSENEESEEKQAQTIIFAKELYSKEEAKEWMTENNFKFKRIDEDEDNLRIVVKTKSMFKKGTLAMTEEETEDGVSVIVGKLKQTDETDFGSPQITLMKGQLALAGEMTGLLKEMLDVMRDSNDKMSDFYNLKADDSEDSDDMEEEKENKEDDEEEAEDSENKEEDGDEDSEDDEEKSLRLDRRKKMIKNFEARVEALTSSSEE